MDIYTTGQIAKLCHVAPRTVSQWIDSGKLVGYRIANSEHRRVEKHELLKFLQANGMPTAGVLNTLPVSRVLLVSPSEILIASCKKNFSLDYILDACDGISELKTGKKLANYGPDCVIVDFQIGETKALAICREVYGSAIVIALVGEADRPDRSVCTQVAQMPVTPADLKTSLDRLTGRAVS